MDTQRAMTITNTRSVVSQLEPLLQPPPCSPVKSTSEKEGGGGCFGIKPRRFRARTRDSTFYRCL